MQIETIKVKDDSELGYKIINLSDFDEKQHKKYVEPKAKK